MTWQHKFKCLGCGLHFVVASWDENWAEQHSVTCPECGESRGFVYWREKSEAHIFELVPGAAELVALTGGDRTLLEAQ